MDSIRRLWNTKRSAAMSLTLIIQPMRDRILSDTTCSRVEEAFRLADWFEFGSKTHKVSDEET